MARRIAEFYQAEVNALSARAEDLGRDALAYRGDDCSCGRPWLPGGPSCAPNTERRGK
jgi:hypothetical protein